MLKAEEIEKEIKTSDMNTIHAINNDKPNGILLAHGVKALWVIASLLDQISYRLKEKK